MELITRELAYEWYLEDHYYEIIPFESRIEYDFMTFLKVRGFEVIEATKDDGQTN